MPNPALVLEITVQKSNYKVDWPRDPSGSPEGARLPSKVDHSGSAFIGEIGDP